jgi:hypothetical protein
METKKTIIEIPHGCEVQVEHESGYLVVTVGKPKPLNDNVVTVELTNKFEVEAIRAFEKLCKLRDKYNGMPIYKLPKIGVQYVTIAPHIMHWHPQLTSKFSALMFKDFATAKKFIDGNIYLLQKYEGLL